MARKPKKDEPVLVVSSATPDKKPDALPSAEPVPGSSVPKEETERLKTEATEEKTERRKKRRKKAKPEPEIDPETQRYADGLKNLSTALLKIACARFPNPIPPTATELDLWNDATNRMLVKYIPRVGDWKEEVEFALVALIVFQPRLKPKKPPKENAPITVEDTSKETPVKIELDRERKTA